MGGLSVLRIDGVIDDNVDTGDMHLNLCHAFSVGVGYVQSLLNHYSAQNAVKKATYS
jgi:hypothetical protein